MKRTHAFLSALFVAAVLFSHNVNAQNVVSNDVPRIISYQGQITTDGIAMNGTHHITATLYADRFAKNVVWQSGYDAEVKNGIFTLLLGSGGAKLPDNSEIDKPLWIGIKIDNGEEMRPLTQLTAVPYALNVPDKSITLAKLADEVKFGIGHTPKTQVVLDNSCGNNYDAGSNSIVAGGCADSNSSSYAFIGAGEYNIIDAASENAAIVAGYYDSIITSWGAFIGGGSFNKVAGTLSSVVGGTGNKQGGGYSFIGGGESNTVGTYYYQTLCGGRNNIVNHFSDYATIGGGRLNTIYGSNSLSTNVYSAEYSTISGGYGNTINGDFSAIAGGRNLTLGSRSFGFSGSWSGKDLSADSSLAYFGDVDIWLGNSYATATKLKFFEPSNSGVNFSSFEARAQGANIMYILPNTIGSATQALTINSVSGNTATLEWGPGGANAWNISGNSNTDPTLGNFLGTINQKDLEIHIYDSDAGSKGSKRVLGFYSNASSANIIGGYQGNNITGAVGSIICGGGSDGVENRDTASFSVIVGGGGNIIQSWTPRNNKYSFIGGGYHNIIYGDEANLSTKIPDDTGCCVTIVGGYNNSASDSGSFIGGGAHNHAQETWSGVVGGFNDSALADFSCVVGGRENTAGGKNSSVVGGRNNKANNPGSFIGGGGFKAPNSTISSNVVNGNNSSVVGGIRNRVFGTTSFIGGGDSNFVSSNSSSIASGFVNVDSANFCFIGGGRRNMIRNLSDFSGITSGDSGVIFRSVKNAFIGGGANNAIGDPVNLTGSFSNIPGGDHDTARSYAQTVIGYYNLPQGSSVKPTKGLINTINPNDRVFIIGAGQEEIEAQVDPPVSGQSEIRKNAFEVSNSGHSIVYHSNGPTASVLPGATYVDNTITAWGHVQAAGVVTSKFGCTVVHFGPANKYDITVNLVDPYTGATVSIANGSAITATLVNVDGSPHCGFITTTAINPANNTFSIFTWADDGNCSPLEKEFMFHVVARP